MLSSNITLTEVLTSRPRFTSMSRKLDVMGVTIPSLQYELLAIGGPIHSPEVIELHVSDDDPMGRPTLHSKTYTIKHTQT